MTTTAYLYANAIVLDVPHRDTRKMKMVPGSRFHARADEHALRAHFTLPLAWASCVALRGVFGNDLVVDDALFEWAAEYRRTRIAPAMELRDLLEPPAGVQLYDELPAELRPYQKVGSGFLIHARQAILADEMRVGKTPTAIGALRYLDARPALIVAPNSVKFQWEEAIRRWWPEATPTVIRGTARQRRDLLEELACGETDVGIINWEALRLHTRLAGYGSVVSIARCDQHGGDGLVPESKCEAHPRELNEIHFQAVVADEAHRAVHPRTKQARALWAVGWAAEYRFALTGTPVLNSPEDLWALGHWISPEEFPSKTAWLDRYGLTGWNPFGGLDVIGLRQDTKDELFSFVDPRFLRRERKLVMPWLPDKIYTERTVELGSKQRRAYNAMRDQMLVELEGGSTYVTNALAKLTRLRQFASAYAEINEDGDLRLSAPSSKVEAMLDIAEELGGKPAAVFAESAQLIKLTGAALTKAGYEVGYIIGDVSDVDRQTYVTAFQRGDLQFLLLTLGAGGEGLTLDRADVCVMMQRSFSLARNQQAEDRIVGQTSGAGIEIIDIVARDTIETRVKEILEEKGRITEEIVRDRETYLRVLGMEE